MNISAPKLWIPRMSPPRADASTHWQQRPDWLRVQASAGDGAPFRIYINGVIGQTFWDDSGVSARQFRTQLDAIPRGTKIEILINSDGGSVTDSLDIYNALRERAADVVTINTGAAYSMASVLLCAGSESRAPATSMVMVHDPWSSVTGNAAFLRKSADMLDTYAKTLIAAYVRKTGKSEAEIKAAMAEETYMTGEEAKAFGLVDVLIDATPDMTLALRDPGTMRKPHPHLVAAWNSRRPQQPAPTPTTPDPMNRSQILALLKKHGVTPQDSATDADLVAALSQLVVARKVTAAEFTVALGEPQAAAPTPAPAPVSAATVDLAPVVAAINRLEAVNAAQRQRDAEAAVDQLIAERRHPVAARAALVTQVLTGGQEVLANLRAYPAHQPGGDPVAEFTVTSDDPKDVFRGIDGLRAPVKAFRRGEDVSRADLTANARHIGAICAKNAKKLEGMVYGATTHTIHADLKRVVLLNGPTMRAFKRRIIALSGFSTVFTGIPFRTEGGLDQFEVPFYELNTDASTDFVIGTGYVYSGNTDVGVRKVTCDKRKFQPMDFDSVLLSRQPAFNPEMHMMLKAEQLAVDVFTDVTSIITKANFGPAVKPTPADAFDADDFADIKTVVDRLYWPEIGRSMTLESAYGNALFKDNRLRAVDASGDDSLLRRGVTKQIDGFDIFTTPAVPGNGEGLVGWVAFLSAILVGVAPVEPAPGVRAQLLSYEVVTDPDTGISFSYRHGGDQILDRDQRVIECAYGYGKGHDKALRRIVSGTPNSGI